MDFRCCPFSARRTSFLDEKSLYEQDERYDKIRRKIVGNTQNMNNVMKDE